MTDYNAMSDFDINKWVAKSLGEYTEPPYGCEEFKLGDAGAWYDDQGVINDCFVDYCNNPEDAWPIIEKYHICIVSTDVKSNQWCAYNWDDCDDECWNENPLRAACTVYLMKMEGE